MASHGSDKNGLNWEDGHIAYHELYTVKARQRLVSTTSTPMAFQNANFSPNYWGALLSICKTLIALCQHLSIINTGVACLVTNFLTSIAQPKPRTRSTVGWCTTCRRNLMSNALSIWHVILPNLFQEYKTRKSLCLPVTLLSTMSARRRRIDTTEPSQLPTLEANNPLFPTPHRNFPIIFSIVYFFLASLPQWFQWSD